MRTLLRAVVHAIRMEIQRMTRATPIARDAPRRWIPAPEGGGSGSLRLMYNVTRPPTKMTSGKIQVGCGQQSRRGLFIQVITVAQNAFVNSWQADAVSALGVKGL